MMAPARARLLDFRSRLGRGREGARHAGHPSCRRCRGSRMARWHVRGPPIVVTLGRYCGSPA